ncbi:acyltransferase family protein [Hufsiella ginkgonis]|uniref:DUF1624 domain-containing protein n=1 Tax=Hufsiella ginkgonis TaxID=2695274 RepID=A0A7K1XZQ2_9SPHI|nr:heparan-alpha-glucosaminide N-acetyltransferase domain-containing protein [Hufsiella ginkgonis]MXV16453.1 DUF1624 domain-containing protein [Hufsiella ginkgonis]
MKVNPGPRSLSLDVFRGMTVCFMIIVNNPGDWGNIYAPLEHASWHGLTPTDLVFPSFLFAVGNAMSFSLKKYSELGNAALIRKILVRTLLIFAIGVLLFWFPFYNFDKDPATFRPFSHVRIFGVLQRIALCYCFASLMVHFLFTRWVIITSAILLVGYWAVLLLFADASGPLSMTGNAGARLDTFLLGNDHLYHGEGVPFDPEGILSTLPAIVNVIIGYYAGRLVQLKGKGYDTLTMLLLSGCLAIFAALCWNMVLPINKKLWTSSFVLVTSGTDLIILAFLIFCLELKNWNNGNWTYFFLVFGRNTLFIYVLSDLLVQLLYAGPAIGWKANQWIGRYISHGKPGSLLYAVLYMLLCWSIGWILDKRKIYIKI